MKALSVLFPLAFAGVVAAHAADAPTPMEVASRTTLVNIALIMGEPNFSVDGGYQELEEGFYTKPELKAGKKMFAPIQDIVTQLGGDYRLEAAAGQARYELGGHRLELVSGNTQARFDGEAVILEMAPELRDKSMWVPLDAVFRLFGAYTKWEEGRQRFSAALILPSSKKTEDLAKGGPVTEASLLTQTDAFYRSTQGRQLADVVLAYQNADGGWPKLDSSVNMLVPINTAHLTGMKGKSTIDNDSTMKQVRVLARAHTAFGDEKYRTGFERGLDYILSAQLANGGWQQFWPEPLGYKARITINDNAMANVLDVLRDIVLGDPEFRFVDAGRKARAKTAFDKGIDLLLRTQLTVAGRKTGWCAQYDENTLQPAMGRAFELASISGYESVGVLRFLMSLEQPSPAVVQAVQDAVAWFAAARMAGIKRVKKADRTLENGFDYVIEPDPDGPGLWARFYDLKEGKPLFSSRDSVPRSDFSDVSYERRAKYNWFTQAPQELLERDYPAWQARWAPQHNVLR